MTDKEDYYVPTIEEIHVGFQYEFRSLKGWEARTFNSDDGGYFNNVSEMKEYISEEIIRVKHLDREDIENFGFELDQCTKDGCVFYKGNLMSEEEWCLTFGGKTNPKNYLSIHSLKNNPNSFTGTVKNKSELKIILKQLGIL